MLASMFKESSAVAFLILPTAATPTRIIATDQDWRQHNAIDVKPTLILADKFGSFMELPEVALVAIKGHKLNDTAPRGRVPQGRAPRARIIIAAGKHTQAKPFGFGNARCQG